MSKFVYNRATTRICAKKPFIENSHYAQKKSKQTSLLAGQHLLLWFQREHVIQLTDNCEWKAQNLWEKWRKSKPDELVSLKNVLKVGDPKLSRVLNIQNDVHASEKFAKRATCEFFSAFFFLLPVGSGPKRSMPIEKLSSSSLVSSIFQREGKLHCSLTGRKLWSQVNKMLTSSYLRTGVRKLRICS